MLGMQSPTLRARSFMQGLVLSVALASCGGGAGSQTGAAGGGIALDSGVPKTASGGGSTAGKDGAGSGQGGTTSVGGGPAGGQGGTASWDGGTESGNGDTASWDGGTAADDGGAETGDSAGDAAGVTPLVLIVDKATDRFAAYDRDGQLVHDYHSLLDFGDQYQGPIISASKQVTRWDTTAGATSSLYWLAELTGLAGPVAPSAIIVGARRVGGGSVRIKIASVAGDVFADLEIAGEWQVFGLSPGRRYLLAADTALTRAAVVRLSDASVVWQGSPAEMVAFSPDDAHFISVPRDYRVPFQQVDLDTGLVREPDLSKLPFPFDSTRQHVFVDTALASGAVITADYGYGVTLTRQLWWVDWQGKMTPLDATLPQYVYEEFTRWDATGTQALWWRTDLPSIDPAVPLGYFAFDLSTMQSEAWTDVGGTWPSAGAGTQHIDSTDCFGGAASTFFGIVGDSLMSCDCSNGNCTPIASLGPASPDWTSGLVVSPDRRIVAVHFSWTLSSRMPTTGKDTLLFLSTGALVGSLPYGTVVFDRLSQLLVTYNLMPDSQDRGIVNLATGDVTWLGKVTSVAIVYE